MMRELVQDLSPNQQNIIWLQRNPDGRGYKPRKVTARTKKERIKRQMFAKLRTAKHMKTAVSTDSASVEFESKVQRIARVRHYGLRDRISCKRPEVRYTEWRLLGINGSTLELVNEDLIR